MFMCIYMYLFFFQLSHVQIAERVAYKTSRRVITSFVPGRSILRLPILRAVYIFRIFPVVYSYVDILLDLIALKISSLVVTVHFM